MACVFAIPWLCIASAATAQYGFDEYGYDGDYYDYDGYGEYYDRGYEQYRDAEDFSASDYAAFGTEEAFTDSGIQEDVWEGYGIDTPDPLGEPGEHRYFGGSYYNQGIGTFGGPGYPPRGYGDTDYVQENLGYYYGEDYPLTYGPQVYGYYDEFAPDAYLEDGEYLDEEWREPDYNYYSENWWDDDFDFDDWLE